MNPKILSLLALAVALVFAGCAQDSTDTTDDNPAMQEQVMKGTAAEGASAAAGSAATDKTGSSMKSTDTTRTPAKGGTSGTKVALAADPTGALKYNTTSLNAGAGDVTIAFQNKSSVPHNVTITGSGNKKLGATADISGSSAVLKLKGVKAGTYTFFCSIPGHEQAGMKGTLTVR
jgi:plastocyanin